MSEKLRAFIQYEPYTKSQKLMRDDISALLAERDHYHKTLERIAAMVNKHDIIDAVHEAKRALGLIPERIDR